MTPNGSKKRRPGFRIHSLRHRPSFAFHGMAIRSLLDEGAFRGFSAYQTTMAPGTTHPPTVHLRTDELIYVLSGRGAIKSGERWRRLLEGDVVWVPQGCPHEVRTVLCGLRVLSVFSPPMTRRNLDIHPAAGTTARRGKPKAPQRAVPAEAQIQREGGLQPKAPPRLEIRSTKHEIRNKFEADKAK